MKNRVFKRILGVLGFAALFAAMIAATMLLWNALLPQIFGLITINFWQAAGLLILARLLFGGIGRGGHHHGRCFGHDRFGFGHGRHGFGRGDKELKDKLKGMSRDERRAYIREHMHNHFDRSRCSDRDADSSQSDQ